MWRFWGGACFVIVLLAAFGQPLLALAKLRGQERLYSYILLIPFVSAYLLYLRRDQLPKNCVTDLPAWDRVAWLPVSALCLFTAGRISRDKCRRIMIAFAARPCRSFAVLQREVFSFSDATGCEQRLFRWPISFSWFRCRMQWQTRWRPPRNMPRRRWQMFFFTLRGTPFLRAGPIFQLPNITIEVAQECSGIRSSWVLLMTSILAANLFLKTSWRRIVLVAFVIPLGILRNGFRILVIGLLCVNVGPQMIHSVIHRRGGPVFFVLSLIPFLLLLWWLAKGETRTRSVESR